MSFNDFLIYADKVLQTNRTTYPTIFVIAMDYLSIQASSVLCKRVFSLSAEMDMKQRNHISPLMMEALQMLKFQLQKECLDFMMGWKTLQEEMINNDLKENLLQKVLLANFQDNLDSLIQTIDKDKDKDKDKDEDKDEDEDENEDEDEDEDKDEDKDEDEDKDKDEDKDEDKDKDEDED